MANTLDVTLHALGQESADGSGAGVDIEVYRQAVKLVLTVTAQTATAVNYYVETGPDNAAWRRIGILKPSGPGAAKVEQYFDECDRYVRVAWTITGGTVDFSVAGEANTLIAGEGDIELPAGRVAQADPQERIKALIAASCDAEAALALSNPTPITKWPQSIRRRVGEIAAYILVKRSGFRPEDVDELLVTAHNDAQKWLMSVGRGVLKPPGIEPPDNLGPRETTGDPDYPDDHKPRMSDNWGDF